MSDATDPDDKSEEQRSVDALWREFKSVGSQELRDRLEAKAAGYRIATRAVA